MSNFITMINRIASELRRSNLTTEIKRAINDAIDEASKTRFYFNEFETTFDTAYDTDFYADPWGMVEVDFAYRLITSNQKEELEIIHDALMDEYLNDGNRQRGIPRSISIWQGGYRFDPIPDGVYFMFLKGYGRKFPVLTTDSQTNNWLTDAEQYIRALAKRNLLRDVIRDYGEAGTLEKIAEGYKDILLTQTNLKMSTGTVRSTQF